VKSTGLVDAAGNRIRNDPLDRILHSIDASGEVTYDENGNVRTVRDPRYAASHVFTYDARDRVESYTDPLGNTESHDYDGMGNLRSMTDSKGQVTLYTYDALDHLKTATHADGSVITLVWDAGNRVLQLIDSAYGAITLDYGDLDRLMQVEDGVLVLYVPAERARHVSSPQPVWLRRRRENERDPALVLLKQLPLHRLVQYGAARELDAPVDLSGRRVEGSVRIRAQNPRAIFTVRWCERASAGIAQRQRYAADGGLCADDGATSGEQESGIEALLRQESARCG